MAPRKSRRVPTTQDRVRYVAQAREAAEAASARYRAAIIEAREAGVPVRHIASATGLTRQRVYVLLKTARERASA